MENADRKAGLQQVAKLAGVSLSTVDRVLNERGSVSDNKRRKVLQAARTLGLRRLLPSATHGLLRFDLLMVDSATDHFRRLAAGFNQEAQLLRSRLVLQQHRWDERYPEQLLELINTPHTTRQGLLVVAQDTPQIRHALQSQIAQGIPVVLLTTSLSDLPGATYIGIDNNVAGRSAARLLSHWANLDAGSVLLITNSLLYHAHQQRVAGFLQVLHQRAPQLNVVGPIECYDDPTRSAHAVRDAVMLHDTIAAIYDSGSGSSGIRAALLELDIRPVWIGHEATPEHAALLREGLLSLVLDQDPEGQAKAAIQHLLYANGDLEEPPQTAPQLRIVIEETLAV
ncbi:LacI family DNA-binding transcriptional regulator [Pseudomonas eucalypticola]|uniref:LacI family DNA-binding transcriptional regulator n=1 Tax=Pseudomonas eucalypticola TaxID=2599595 RepID=A0A7D5D696_9PSED|nr:LacI family DNA-binding transcriptional regulator [Pseudomonas eucalypticola]QKZ04234.1 LacI family DNA-binding transcriptional regulator [Pseudomonas eucalypticola]